MKAMILAAGLGTRLRPFTNETPKPLFELGGVPLIHIVICKLQASGCKSVMINTHHLAPKIEAFIKSQSYNIPVLTRYEPILLETGGGIKNVSDFWDEKPFLVINGDIFSDIDLEKTYRYHLTHDCPVTMVLHDYTAFNHVWVSRENRILGFGKDAPCPPDDAGRSASVESCLAFTGIHVLDPLVLDYIPAGRPSGIIDAYCHMIHSGLKIQGLKVKDHSWHDIGTLDGYRNAAREALAQKAFDTLVSTSEPSPLRWNRLHGDGSDRTWFRVLSKNTTVILADHGDRPGVSSGEAESFYAIGTHLKKRGVPVPRIYGYDPILGIIVSEDMGDSHLQTVVHKTHDQDAVFNLYERIIDHLVHMGVEGARNFDTAWTFQTSHYDQALILEKECRYFVDAFLQGYAGQSVSFADLEEDFRHLSEGASVTSYAGFLHRDFQSRNIMVRGRDLAIIDYQGGRIGPLQYDLASLLIDPYVVLPKGLQKALFDIYVRKLSQKMPVDIPVFTRGFHYCAVTRNLQALGAFGFLSKVKGKTFFEQYIPPAIQTLKENIKEIALADESPLRKVVEGL